MAKSKGAIIPDPVDPPGTRKLVICIPDTVEWLSLVTGCVAQMTFGWYWDRTTGDLDAVRDRAKRMYFEMQDQNGDCIMLDCGEVADCIENSDAVKAALTAFTDAWLQDQTLQPFPETKLTEELAGGFNPTCDYDIIWSQSVAVVERANTFITDLLEQLADEDTIAKMAGVLAGLPGIENLGLGSVTDLASVLFEVPLTLYSADYTEVWAEALECELFCLARDDCKVTIEQIFDIVNARVTAAVPELTPPLVPWDMVGWALAIGTYVSDLAAINKADLMFYIVFGGLRFGSTVLGAIDGFRLFNIAAMLAADEPSNDWETLCTDCVWSHEYDFTVSNGGFVSDITGGFAGTWNSTDGWYRDSVSQNPTLGIWKAWTGALGGTITAIEIDVVIPQQGSTTRQVAMSDMDQDGSPATTFYNNLTTTTGTHTYTASVSRVVTNAGWRVAMNQFLVTNGQRYKIKRVKISGTGNDPLA